MKEQKIIPKFKHVREKDYSSSHPLYDAMKSICNPDGENSGHTAEYNGMTFQLNMCKDTYYDEQGIPQSEVTVMGLDEQEDRWHVYRRNAEELAEAAKKIEQQEFNPHTVDYIYREGHISWIEKREYNERRELIHMEQAFYGDDFLHEFSDTPYYTLISDLTYEYDEYGNWVLCYLHCVDGLQPDELTIREIEYQPLNTVSL
ncbi:MAG: hypothetical protein IJ841_01765 [Prevotella sp.]|nr:hypothetical protein [Prevotella sp.]